jgi:hypothetical protein
MSDLMLAMASDSMFKRATAVAKGAAQREVGGKNDWSRKKYFGKCPFFTQFVSLYQKTIDL